MLINYVYCCLMKNRALRFQMYWSVHVFCIYDKVFCVQTWQKISHPVDLDNTLNTLSLRIRMLFSYWSLTRLWYAFDRVSSFALWNTQNSYAISVLVLILGQSALRFFQRENQKCWNIVSRWSVSRLIFLPVTRRLILRQVQTWCSIINLLGSLIVHYIVASSHSIICI